MELNPEDLDIIAVRQADGLFVLRRWNAHRQELVQIPGHSGRYDEDETHRRLGELRLTGNTFVREGGALRLVP